MVKQKKAVILIYPEFSNYEISIISAIFKTFQKEIVVLAVEKNIVDSDKGWFSGIKKPIKAEDYTFFIKD